MSDRESCLVKNLKHYIDLNENERRHIARLEKEEKAVPPRTTVSIDGAVSDHLIVVKEGWLYAYADTPDGRRQIVSIYNAGDIVGFGDIAFHKLSTSLRSCTDARVCPFPKSALDDIFIKSPRLSAMLFTIAVREQVMLSDRLRSMGRMNARERLAAFLLTLQSRLRITNGPALDTFRLPLTQTEIGDAIGLTNVSVSNGLKSLENDRLITRSAGRVTLLEEDALVELGDYTDRYDTIDVSWFPKSSDTTIADPAS